MLVCSQRDLTREVLRLLEHTPDRLLEGPLRRMVALKERYAPAHRRRALGLPDPAAVKPGILADLFAAPELLRTPEPVVEVPPFAEHLELAERLLRER